MRGKVITEIYEQLKTLSVAEIIRQRGCKPQNVYNVLKRLEKKGLIRHAGHKKWEVINHEPAEPEPVASATVAPLL